MSVVEFQMKKISRLCVVEFPLKFWILLKFQWKKILKMQQLHPKKHTHETVI